MTLSERHTGAASGMISEMESAFQSGVESGQIPGAVIMAKDLTGMLSNPNLKKPTGKALPVVATIS